MSARGLWGPAATAATAATESANDLLLVKGGRAMIAGLLLLIYLALVWIVGGRETFADELELKIAASLAPILIYPAVWIPLWIRAVSSRYANAVSRSEYLRERLEPKVKMSFPPNAGVTVIRQGVVHVSINGGVSTAERWPRTVVRIACQNVSKVRATGCRAQITNVREVTNDGALRDTDFLEPIDLPWTRDPTKSYLTSTDIEPGSTKSLYVLVRGANTQLGYHIDPNDLPLEYVMMLEATKKYRFWVTLSSDPESVADEIVFDAWADPSPTSPPPVCIEIQRVDETIAD